MVKHYKTLAHRVAKQKHPLRIRALINTPAKQELSTTVRILKNSPIADFLGMTHQQLTSAAQAASVTDLLYMLETLSAELRRVNQLAADLPQENLVSTLTAGELRKVLAPPGAAAEINVAAIQREIELRLKAVLQVYEDRVRQDPYQDGNITKQALPESRNVPRTLDDLEAWAFSHSAMADRLQRTPNDDYGANALGLSKSAQEASLKVQKSNTMLPADSFRSSTEPLFKPKQKITKGQGKQPWWSKPSA